MWDKIKFIGLIWGFAVVGMLMVTIMMPFFGDMADIAADAVDGSVNSATYVGGSEAADYSPWVVFFSIPAAAIVFTTLKLKNKV